MEDKNKNSSDKKLFIITPDELAKLGILDSLTTKVKLNPDRNKDEPATTSSDTFKTKIKKNTENLLKSIFSQKKVSDNDHMVFKKPNKPIKSKELKNVKPLQTKKTVQKTKMVSKTKLVKVASMPAKGQKMSNKAIKPSAVLNKSDQRKIKIISNTPVNIETFKQSMEVNPANEPKKFSIISNTIVNFDKEELNKIVKQSSSSSVTKTSTLIKTQKHLNSKFKKSIFKKPQVLNFPRNSKNIPTHNLNSNEDVSKNSNILETILKDPVCNKISKTMQYPSQINRKPLDNLSSISSSSSKLSTITSDHSTNKDKEDNSSEPKYKDIKEGNVVFKKNIVESTSNNKFQSKVELQKDIRKNTIVMDDKLEDSVAKYDKVLEDHFDISNSHCINITSTANIDNSRQKEAHENIKMSDVQELQIIKIPHTKLSGSAELNNQSFSDGAANSSSTISIPLSKNRGQPKKISQTVIQHKIVDSPENVEPDENFISSTSNIENTIVITDILKKVSKTANFELDNSIETVVENDTNLKKESEFNEHLSKNVSVEDLSKKKVDLSGLIPHIPEKLTSASNVQNVYQVGKSTSVISEKPGKVLKTYSRLAKVYQKNLSVDSDTNQVNFKIQGTVNQMEKANTPVLNVLPNQDAMETTFSYEKNKEESESEISISDNSNEYINRKRFSVGIKKRSRIPWRNRMSNNQMEISVTESSDSIPDTQTKILIESDTLIKKVEPLSKKRKYEELKTAEEKIEVQMAKSRSGRKYVKHNYLEIEGMIDKNDELKLQLTDANNISVNSSNMVEGSPKNKRGRKPKSVTLEPVSSYSNDKTDLLEVVNRENLVANDVLVDQVIESVPLKKKRGRPRKSLPSESISDISKEVVTLKENLDVEKEEDLADNTNVIKEAKESSYEIVKVSSSEITGNSLEQPFAQKSYKHREPLSFEQDSQLCSLESPKIQNPEGMAHTKILNDSVNESSTINSFDVQVKKKSGRYRQSLASESISDISNVVILKENLDVEKQEDLVDNADVFKEADKSSYDKIAKDSASGTTSGDNLEQPLPQESDKHQAPLAFKQDCSVISSESINILNPEDIAQARDINDSVNQSSIINVQIKKKSGRPRKALLSESISDISKEVTTLKESLDVEKVEDVSDNTNVLREINKSSYDKIVKGSASGTTSGDNLEQPLPQESDKYQVPLAFKQDCSALSSESIKIQNPEAQARDINDSVNQSSIINVQIKKKRGRPRKGLPSEGISDITKEVITLKEDFDAEKVEDVSDNTNLIRETNKSSYDKIVNGSASGTTSGDNLEQPLPQESDKHQAPVAFKQDCSVLSSESIKVQNPEGVTQASDMDDSVNQRSIINVQIKKKSGRPRKGLPSESISDITKEVVTLKENLDAEKKEDLADNADVIKDANESTYDKIAEGSASGTASSSNLEQPLTQISDKNRELLSFGQDSPVLPSESIKINRSNVPFKKKRGRPRKSVLTEGDCEKTELEITDNKLIDNINNAMSSTINNISDVAFERGKESKVVPHKNIPSTTLEKSVPINTANIQNNGDEGIFKDDEKNRLQKMETEKSLLEDAENNEKLGLLSNTSYQPEVMKSEIIESKTKLSRKRKNVSASASIAESQRAEFKTVDNQSNEEKQDIELGDTVNEYKSVHGSNILDFKCEEQVYTKMLDKEVSSTCDNSTPVVKKKRGRKPKGTQPTITCEKEVKVEEVVLPLEESKRGRKRAKVNYLEMERLAADDDEEPTKKQERSSKDDTFKTRVKIDICSEKSGDASLEPELPIKPRKAQTGRYTNMVSNIFAKSLKSDNTEENPSERIATPFVRKGRKSRNANELSATIDEEGYVTCRHCEGKMKPEEWDGHNKVKHNNLAWKNGEPVLNLDHPRLKSKLKSLLTAKNKFITCLKCQQKYKTTGEFILHTEECLGIITEGKVTCAVCNTIMPRESWISHRMKHNTLAWRIGEYPLDIQNETFVLQTLNAIYQTRKPLYCYKCNGVKKSVVGLLSHFAQCGKDVAEAQVSCKLCNRKMLPVSIPTHMKMMHETPRKVQTAKPGSSYFDIDMESTQQKRKAAKKAIAKMDTLASDTEVTKQHFVKQMNFEEDIFLTKYLNKELEDNKTLKCKIKDCEFSCGDTSEMIAHLSACSLKPDQYYTCKVCFLIEPTVQEIINHLTIIHSITVKRKNDDDFEDNGENSNEDELELERRFRKKKRNKGEHVVSKQVVKKPDFILRSVKKQEPRDFLYSSAFQFTINFANKNFNSKVIFENLKCNQSDWDLLNDDYLESYLPSSELSCDVVIKNMGAQNIYKQEHTFKKFELFETECGDDHATIFCGGPILCQAWLPTPHTSLDHQQILAVATCKNFDGKYNHNEYYSETTLIQFWNFGILKNCIKWSDPKLEFCMAVDNGPIWAMEWCPSGCFNIDETIEFSRRGLLAVAGCSMPVHIYSIPLFKEEETGLLYKPRHVLKLELTLDENDMKRKSFPTKLSWSRVSGHKYLAVGYTDGTVAVYNVDTTSSLLRIGDTLLPYKIIKTHTHFISALSLIPIGEGNRWLLTGSFDKDIHIWDLSSDDKYSIRRKKIIADGAWLTNWISFMTSNDESTAVGAQALTTSNSYREYMYDQCHLSFSSSSVTSISSSDWLNGFIHSNDTGEINAFFPHQMLFDMSKRRKLGKFRFVRGYTKIIDKTLPPEERAAVEIEKKNILKYEVGGNYIKHDKEYLWDEPMNYEEATQKYGVAFCNTNTAELKPDLTNSDSSKPNIYPLQTINKISFNPNRQASLYYATGYQIGFLRLSYLKFLEKDKQIRKSEVVNQAVLQTTG